MWEQGDGDGDIGVGGDRSDCGSSGSIMIKAMIGGGYCVHSG